MPHPMPDRPLKLRIAPRACAGLLVRSDIRTNQAVGGEGSIVQFALQDLAHTLSSRQREAASMGVVLLAVTHETVRYAFHQITSAFQTLGRSARAECRRIRRKARRSGLDLRSSKSRE